MSYGPTQTTWSYSDAPEDKTPLEIRPSLEKGEDSHVRDCLIWHSTTPRQRLQSLERSDVAAPNNSEGYRVFHYGAGGPGYWSNSDCGQSGCRTCVGGDHLINRDVGYVRRNKLGRTIDRGFSSKPDKLKTAEELAASRGYTVRYEPVEPRLRDPYNRPVHDVKPAWNPPKSGWDEWNDGGRSYRGGAGDPAVDRWKSSGDQCCNNQKQCCGPKQPSCCHSCNSSGQHSCNSNYNNNNYNNYDYNYNRPSFPRIDERDAGSVSYRGPPPLPEQSPPRPYRPFDPQAPTGPPPQTRPVEVYEGPKQVVGNEAAFPAPAGMAGASQPTPRKPKGGISFDV